MEPGKTLPGSGLVSAERTATAVSFRLRVFVTPLAPAVRVAVAAVLTGETVAVKLAEVEPAATVTEAGTLTALLLLATLTASPLPIAAVLSVTVQLSVPAPVIEVLVQLKALRVAVFADVAPKPNTAVGRRHARAATKNALQRG